MKHSLALIMALSMLLLVGCSNTCKINGCTKEVYKEGLCQVHYYASEGANLLNDIVGGK